MYTVSRKEYGKLVSKIARDSSENVEDDIRTKKAVDLLKGNLILDLGCSKGEISSYIKRKLNANVIGADFSEEALKEARKRGIECYNIDIENPLPKNWANKFDAVLLSEVIEHVFDTDFVIKEIKKILKPNGILVITTPNTCRLPYRGLMVLGYAPRSACEYRATGKEAGHIRSFDIHRIRILLEENGFKVEKIKGDLINFLLFKSKYLADIFPNLANSFVVKAVK